MYVKRDYICSLGMVFKTWNIELVRSRPSFLSRWLGILIYSVLGIISCIVLKLGPARRVDPGLEPGRIEEKIEKIMTRCDSADPVDWPDDPEKPGQKLGCSPLTFVFFMKMTSFWFFFKIGIDPADPMTRSKPNDLVKTRNPGLGPGRV